MSVNLPGPSGLVIYIRLFARGPQGNGTTCAISQRVSAHRGYLGMLRVIWSRHPLIGAMDD